MKKCMVYLDSEHMKSSIQLLEVITQIYGNEDVETYGVEFLQESEEPVGYFSEIIRVIKRDAEYQDIRYMTAVLTEIQEIYRFDCIVVPATWTGRMLAPRLAVRLHTGLTADVVEVRRNADGIEMIRPAFGGRIMAGIRNVGEGPVMMSVRENVFQYGGQPDKNTRITYFQDHSIAAGVKLVSVQEKSVQADIRDSRVLVSGGGGITQGFQDLQELADLLNGQVAASRKIIDSGLAPRAIQVGQSGKTVSPKLYLALGIHGAMQHIEGIQNVEHLIAVNTNRCAPICSMADIVVEGDAQSFVHMLVDKIKREKSQ